MGTQLLAGNCGVYMSKVYPNIYLSPIYIEAFYAKLQCFYRSNLSWTDFMFFCFEIQLRPPQSILLLFAFLNLTELILDLQGLQDQNECNYWASFFDS